MNKQELLKKYNEEEKLLISKVLDKIKFVKGKNRVEITDFLNMYEQKIVKDILNKIQEENYILYGGFEAAERKLILFYPEKLENIFQEKIPNCNQYINTVRIELPNEMHGKYVHKNYLSGLMKLGVKREKIGDIIVADDGADILVKPDVLKFLLQNLPELKRFSKSEIKQIEIENLRKPNIQKEEITIIVPSLRLDSIVAELANISRNKATTFITSERVLVNYMVETKTSKEIKIEDTITIRGKGRYVVKKQIGTSKKGKQIIKIEKFK